MNPLMKKLEYPSKGVAGSSQRSVQNKLTDGFSGAFQKRRANRLPRKKRQSWNAG